MKKEPNNPISNPHPFKESDIGYRILFENASDGILIIEKDGTIVAANEAFTQIHGYLPDELNKISLADLDTPSVQNFALSRIEKILAGEKLVFETEHYHKDGHILSLKVSAQKISIQENEYIIGFHQDISEQKKTQRALKESEERFKGAFETAAHGMAIVGIDGNFIHINESFCNIVGYTKKELLSIDFKQITHPEDLDLNIKYYKQLLANEIQSFQMEKRYYHKNGHIIWVLLSVSFVKDFANIPIHFVSQIIDITKKKQTELDTKQNEEKFRILFEDANDAIFLAYAETGIIADANKKAESLLGYSRTDIVGMHQSELHPAKISDQVKNSFQSHIKSNNQSIIQGLTVINKKGETIPVEISASSIELEGNTYIYGIFRDISELQRAEAALKKSEENLKSIINESPFPIAVADLKNEKIYYWSHSAKEMFGHSPSNVSEWFQLAYPDPDYCQRVLQQWNPYMMQALQSGKTINAGDYKIKCQDGTFKICNLYVQHISDNLVIRFNDITKRLQIEQELQNTLKGLEKAQNIARMGSWQYDPCENKPIWSDGLYKIYERVPDKGPFPIEKYEKIYDKENFGIFKNAFRRAVNEGVPYDIVLKLNLPGNITKWVRSICESQEYTGDAGYFLRGTIQDITAYKLQDDIIKRQNMELKELIEAKDKFMSILAHDLKNPIHGLRGLSELLIENIHNGDLDSIKEVAILFNETAITTSKLLEEILEWSRAQQGKIPYEPKDFCFYNACTTVLEQANNIAKTKRILIHCNIPVELTVFTDINLLKTIVRNLLSNAIKFTTSGGTITLDAKETEKEIVASIADTGVGMKKEIVTQIFSKRSISTTSGTNNEKGSGLGLQVCKEFIKMMGGKIWVESEPDQGSIFYFTIPKKRNKNRI